MTRIITRTEFTNAVREVLEQRGPEFVYHTEDGCHYGGKGYDEGGDVTEGSCLYGAVLIEKLGLPYYPEWESHTIDVLVRHPRAFGIEARFEFEDDDQYIGAHVNAQCSQDVGVSYCQVAIDLDPVFSAEPVTA